MGDAVDDHEETQGALQLGEVQVSPAGRTHRSRAQGAQTLKPSSRKESSKQSETRQEPPKKKQRNKQPIDIPHDPSESQLHQSVALLLDWILLEPAFYTTFPAGWGRLSKGTAGRLFASGLKKGMPDLLVFAPGKAIGIELKVGHNSLTSAQRAMHARLQAVGVTVYTCRDQHGVVIALRDAEIPHRKHSLWENP